MSSSHGSDEPGVPSETAREVSLPRCSVCPDALSAQMLCLPRCCPDGPSAEFSSLGDARAMDAEPGHVSRLRTQRKLGNGESGVLATFWRQFGSSDVDRQANRRLMSLQLNRGSSGYPSGLGNTAAECLSPITPGFKRSFAPLGPLVSGSFFDPLTSRQTALTDSLEKLPGQSPPKTRSTTFSKSVVTSTPAGRLDQTASTIGPLIDS